MTGKSQADYTAVFNKIKELLGEDLRLQEFMVDFEAAEWEALRICFPGITIKGYIRLHSGLPEDQGASWQKHTTPRIHG